MNRFPAEEPEIQDGNVIRQFAKNIIESVADAGEKFLDLRRRGTTSQDLITLCEDLISHRGAASGIALAREVVNRYRSLDRDEKRAFFLQLSRQIRPEMEEIQRAAAEFAQTPDERTLRDLSAAMTSNRRKLFSRMNMAPNGTAAIVALRQDLMGLMREDPELKPIDEDLKTLLQTWFNPGFLTLQRIDWNTEASILEKIIQYEAVHSIQSWDDLKQRLAARRRCFAFFHPALDDEPLIFVEVALTKNIPSSIQMILNHESKDSQEADTAVFYSINNCQYGLRRIPLGNFLIRRVVTELLRELPSIKTFCTLSPVSGFSKWLRNELSSEDARFLPGEQWRTLRLIENPDWHLNQETCQALKEPLLKACAHYLINAKRNDKPLNPVARFHFGNGASLHRINWLGDTSEHGISEYLGLMINYHYDLKHIDSNHEAYVQRGELAVSKSIRTILGTKR
jgi:malonyl-CoA decarboxylase